MLTHSEIAPGISLSCIQDHRFKHSAMTFQYLRPMCTEEAAMNALIPSVLLRGCKSAPDLRRITQRLDDLYGASVSPISRRAGNCQTTGLYLSLMDDRFAPEGEALTEQAIAFLKELLFDYPTEQGGFLPDFVEGEKINQIYAIEAEYNDKQTYCSRQLLKSMCREDPFGVPRLGEPADVEALMACKMGDGTVDDALKALILVIKENIKVRRFARYEGHCAAYVHGGGTHGVIVKFETSDDVAAKPEFAAFGKDIAMQVAAANPSYLNESDVPEDVLAKEKEIVLAQMANDPKTANKPDAIKEKMAIGKLGKFYKEACLVDQAFIKDGGMDVKKYVADTAKALGGDIKIAAFTHFTKGEGLEKRNEDFAAEVAAAIKG